MCLRGTKTREQLDLSVADFFFSWLSRFRKKILSDGFTDRGRGIRFPSSPRSLTVEHLGTVSGRFELLSADHFPKIFRGGDRSMRRAIVQVFFILGFFGFLSRAEEGWSTPRCRDRGLLRLSSWSTRRGGAKVAFNKLGLKLVSKLGLSIFIKLLSLISCTAAALRLFIQAQLPTGSMREVQTRLLSANEQFPVVENPAAAVARSLPTFYVGRRRVCLLFYATGSRFCFLMDTR